MKEKTVLVIDDSTTIRRLCDSELSAAGYRVLTAATAEDGVETAREQTPDLIILDHQLPGKTGYEVACQLLEFEETATIPVVASSTLRKKAYVEYVDCDNVVDMLPKPYTPEALIATIESAINTAAMVVQSQSEGSAVPEVIDELGDSDLSGAFGCFGLREILDLLTNGSKSGALEVETSRYRVFIFVARGRIQAVTASGVRPEQVARYMPEALSELAPVMKFTVAGRRGSEVDGLAELLDNKVLDPRLLKKMLRLQAAVLLRFCFTGELKSFRFTQHQPAPHLSQKLPLDASLLSLLVEGALICDASELPQLDDQTGFVRRAIRGQNLDRASLASRHMKLMNLVAEPVTIADMAKQLGWSNEEVKRVVHGFELAELVTQCEVTPTVKTYCLVTDQQLNEKVVNVFKTKSQQITGKIARDWLAIGLLVRRNRPDVLVVQLDQDLTQLEKLAKDSAGLLEGVKLVGIQCGQETDPSNHPHGIDLVLSQDCDEQQLFDAITSQPSDSNNSLATTATDTISTGVLSTVENTALITSSATIESQG